MEKLAENVLGVFCGGAGFRIAAIANGQKQEIIESGKTSDLLAVKIMQLMEKCNLKVNEIDKLVVGVGPGSFTGSRVAVSFAKGLCCGNKKIETIVTQIV